jgi:sugar phosphate isomerase/epimerase
MPDFERLSINHITTPRWALPDAIAGYAKAGIRGIGVWPADVERYGVAATRRAMDQHGLVATSLCCGSMFVATAKADIARQRERNRSLVDQAAALGARSLVCVSGGLAPGEKGLAAARARTRDELAELLGYARAAGVPIGIEPIHPMKAAEVSSLTTLAQANDLCDALGEGIGIVVDVFHVWWDPTLPRELERATNRIVGFHLCDWLVPFGENVSGRGMMGDGVVDIAEIRTGVERARYRGFCEIELPSPAWQLRDPADVVRTCIERYRRYC